MDLNTVSLSRTNQAMAPPAVSTRQCQCFFVAPATPQLTGNIDWGTLIAPAIWFKVVLQWNKKTPLLHCPSCLSRRVRDSCEEESELCGNASPKQVSQFCLTGTSERCVGSERAILVNNQRVNWPNVNGYSATHIVRLLTLPNTKVTKS